MDTTTVSALAALGGCLIGGRCSAACDPVRRAQNISSTIATMRTM